MIARGLAEAKQEEIDAFYASKKWRVLSYKAKLKHGRQCQCCGARAEDGVLIVSDHIKPIRFFWNLRLDIENVQVLCQPCNLGKGSWDKTDHRPTRSIAEIVLGETPEPEKTRLKQTIIEQYSEGLLSAEAAIRAIQANGLKHA